MMVKKLEKVSAFTGLIILNLNSQSQWTLGGGMGGGGRKREMTEGTNDLTNQLVPPISSCTAVATCN